MIDERRLVDLALRLVSTPSFTGSEQAAAELMRDDDIGSVMITDGQTLLGVVTDRDIVIRALAERRDVGGGGAAGTDQHEIARVEAFLEQREPAGGQTQADILAGLHRAGRFGARLHLAERRVDRDDLGRAQILAAIHGSAQS